MPELTDLNELNGAEGCVEGVLLLGVGCVAAVLTVVVYAIQIIRDAKKGGRR